MDVRRVSDLLHAYASLVIFELLGVVEVLLIHSLHDVRFEERLQHLQFAQMHSTCFGRGVIDEQLEDGRGLIVRGILFEELANDDFQRLIVLLLHQRGEATSSRVDELHGEHEDFETADEAVVSLHA